MAVRRTGPQAPLRAAALAALLGLDFFGLPSSAVSDTSFQRPNHSSQVQAQITAKRHHVGKAVTLTFTTPSAQAAGWATILPSSEIAQLQASSGYQLACDAADSATLPRIDRVSTPLGPRAEIEIDGDCFGTSAGSVVLGLSNGDHPLSIKSWSKTAIVADVPPIPGAGRQKAALRVVRGTPSTLRGRVEVVAANATVAPVRPGFRVPDNASATNVASVEFEPGLTTTPLANNQVAVGSCAKTAWNDEESSGCLLAGDPNLEGGWGPWCTTPCAVHIFDFFTTRPMTVASADTGDDVWIINRPTGWGIAGVTLANTLGTVSIGQVSDLNHPTVSITVHWSDASMMEWDQQLAGMNMYGAGYDLAVTLVGPASP
jgi:hypothetical protein